MSVPTDPQTLLTNAACFECIPPGMRLSVLNYLLCQIANNGGGGGGGASAFTQLSDVPNSYAGAGGDQVQVNAAATGLAFVAPIFVLQAGGGYVGGNQTGNARGFAALDVQSGHLQITHVASSAKSIAVGYDNAASAVGAMAFGYQNVVGGANGGGFGTSNNVSGTNAFAFGASNTITATPNAAVFGGSNTVQNGKDLNYVAGYNNTVTAPAGTVGKVNIVGIANTSLDGEVHIFGGSNVASGTSNRSCLIGYANHCSFQNCSAVGNGNQTEGANQASAFGLGNVAQGSGNSCAFGAGNQALGVSSQAFGYQNEVLMAKACAFGYACFVPGTGASGAQAFGYKALSRIAQSMNIGGAIIVRKDGGEAANTAYYAFAGVDTMLLTKNVDLTALATNTITIPTGAHFYPSEVGVICAAASAVTVQPTVEFGVTGTNAALLAPTICTTLSVARARQVFGTLLTNAGQTSLTATVTTGATATSQTGRFYFRGMLIEDN